MQHLVEFVPIADFVAEGLGGKALPNKASWDWFVKRYGDELVERGALIRGRGRRPSLAHRQELPQVVLEILRRSEASARQPSL